MFDNLDNETPSETWLSLAYNFDSGLVCDDDRKYRELLNASVKRAAYTFDKKTKPLLRKKIRIY